MCILLYFDGRSRLLSIMDKTMSPIYDNLPNGGPKTASIIIITIHVILAAPLLLTSFALDVEKMLILLPSTAHGGRNGHYEFCCA